MSIQCKRIYEAAEAADGARVLVDRLWPRGVSKERAALTEWMKDVAPSTALREAFCHMPERYPAFVAGYREELETRPEKRECVRRLLEMARGGTLTLLYADRDTRMNNAVALQAYLHERL